MQTAAVINHGPCQSVELPEGVRLTGNEVFVKRIGKSVLLIPRDANLWDVMAESLHQFTDDFMLERCQPPQQEREGLFA